LRRRLLHLIEVKPRRGDGIAIHRFKEFAKLTGLVDYWKKHGWPDRSCPKGENDFECS
jgi:hypothetical protein